MRNPIVDSAEKLHLKAMLYVFAEHWVTLAVERANELECLVRHNAPQWQREYVAINGMRAAAFADSALREANINREED